MAEEVSKSIGGLLKYLNNSDFKGSKYQEEEPEEINVIQLKGVAGALKKGNTRRLAHAEIAFPGFYVRLPYGKMMGPYDSREEAIQVAHQQKKGWEQDKYGTSEDDET